MIAVTSFRFLSALGKWPKAWWRAKPKLNTDLLSSSESVDQYFQKDFFPHSTYLQHLQSLSDPTGCRTFPGTLIRDSFKAFRSSMFLAPKGTVVQLEQHLFILSTSKTNLTVGTLTTSALLIQASATLKRHAFWTRSSESAG